MKLTNSQLRFLRGLAHGLKPVVLVGAKGVTPPLVTELDGALAHHCRLHLAQLAHRRQELACGQALEQLERVEHDAHRSSRIAELGGDVVPAHLDHARVRPHEPDHRSQRGRLAAAVGADEPEARLRRDGERQVVEGERLAEPLDEPADAQRGREGWGESRSAGHTESKPQIVRKCGVGPWCLTPSVLRHVMTTRRAGGTLGV